MNAMSGAREASDPAPESGLRRGRWIDSWEPEDEKFWETSGRRVARKNLAFSIFAENIGFSVWVLWTIVVINLGNIGITMSLSELFGGFLIQVVLRQASLGVSALVKAAETPAEKLAVAQAHADWSVSALYVFLAAYLVFGAMTGFVPAAVVRDRTNTELGVRGGVRTTGVRGVRLARTTQPDAAPRRQPVPAMQEPRHPRGILRQVPPRPPREQLRAGDGHLRRELRHGRQAADRASEDRRQQQVPADLDRAP